MYIIKSDKFLFEISDFLILNNGRPSSDDFSENIFLLVQNIF